MQKDRSSLRNYKYDCCIPKKEAILLWKFFVLSKLSLNKIFKNMFINHKHIPKFFIFGFTIWNLNVYISTLLGGFKVLFPFTSDLIIPSIFIFIHMDSLARLRKFAVVMKYFTPTARIKLNAKYLSLYLGTDLLDWGS